MRRDGERKTDRERDKERCYMIREISRDGERQRYVYLEQRDKERWREKETCYMESSVTLHVT